MNTLGHRKYKDSIKNPHPHLGSMIRKVMEQKGLSKSYVAREMNITHNTLWAYFKKNSIQFGILWKLCIVLDYDFLSEIQRYYPKELPLLPNAKLQELESKVAELEQANAIYKELLQRP